MTDGTAAHRGLVDFFEWGVVPKSDPWPLHLTKPLDEYWRDDTEELRKYNIVEDDDDLEEANRPHNRDKRPIPCIAIGIAVAIGVGASALTASVVLGYELSKANAVNRAQDLQLHNLAESTAKILLESGITAKHIAARFDLNDKSVAHLYNRTNELEFAYRTRTNMANSIAVLESLGQTARDLPHIINSINTTGIVHPAYVPTDVWSTARELLQHDQDGHRMWLPEATGANASWIQKNQTLVIHVPADCNVDETRWHTQSALKHFNTSMVLRFSSWTDHQVMDNEQLLKFRKLAEEEAEKIREEIRRRDYLEGQTFDLQAGASLAVGVILVLVIIGLIGALYWEQRKKDIARRELYQVAKPIDMAALAAELARHNAAAAPRPLPDPAKYEAVPPPLGDQTYYAQAGEFAPTHAFAAAMLRNMQITDPIANQRNIHRPAPIANLHDI